jgi:hypothetical protein
MIIIIIIVILSVQFNLIFKILEDGYTRDIFLSGAPLLIALWRTMKNEIDQIPVPSLATALKEEQMRVIATALKIADFAKSKLIGPLFILYFCLFLFIFC